MTHEEMNSRLHSHSCSCKLRAHEHAEAHGKAIEAREKAEKGHTGAPAEAMAAILRGHDEQIEKHERMVRVHDRRAEHADLGFLLASPDENDAEYMRENGDLVAAMGKAGRLRYDSDRA